MKKSVKVKSTNKWIILLVCIILVYLAAFIGSFFTSSSVNSEWYQSVRPSITPPNWVFPIVWNILFLLIALSLFFAWTKANKKQKFNIGILFAINLILNIYWSIDYFKLHNPLLAFIDLIILWISIIAMMSFTYKVSKESCWLLLPYLLWVTFAGILNYLSII